MSEGSQSEAPQRRLNHTFRPLGLVFGVGFGMALGLVVGMMVLDDIALGMACGSAIGAGFGLAIGSGADTARLVRQTNEGSTHDDSQK